MIRRRLLIALVLLTAPRAAHSEFQPGVIIGTYTLRPDGVVDGDTLRVTGLKRSIRVLSLDTEETHGELTKKQRALMTTDFAAYCKEMQGDAPLPRKYPTPAGQLASKFAKSILKAGDRVVLEKDDPNASSKGSYGRTIAHVFIVSENGKRWLFAERMIRSGHSPYYMKYGRSKRFDKQLRAAQADARKNKRGIWADGAQCYPRYGTILAWWERRAKALDWYGAQQKANKAPIQVGSKNAIRKLSRRVDKPDPVAVFGLIDDKDKDAIREHANGATLRIGGQRYIEVEVVGKELAAQLKLKQLLGELIAVQGPLDRKGNKLNERLRYMRIVVTRAEQLQTPGAPITAKR